MFNFYVYTLTANILIIFMGFFFFNFIWVKKKVVSALMMGLGYIFLCLSILIDFLNAFEIIQANEFLRIIFLGGSYYFITNASINLFMKNHKANIASLFFFLFSLLFATFLNFYVQDTKVLVKWYMTLFLFPFIMYLIYFFYQKYLNLLRRPFIMLAVSYLIDYIFFILYIFVVTGKEIPNLPLNILYIMFLLNKVLIVAYFYEITKVDEEKSHTLLNKADSNYVLPKNVIDYILDYFGNERGNELLLKAQQKLTIPWFEIKSESEEKQFVDMLVNNVFMDIVSVTKIKVIKAKILSLLSIDIDDVRYQTHHTKSTKLAPT